MWYQAQPPPRLEVTVLDLVAVEAAVLGKHVGAVHLAAAAAGEEVEADGVATLNTVNHDRTMKAGDLGALAKLSMGSGVAGLAVDIGGRGLAAAVDGQNLLGDLTPVSPEVPTLTLLDLKSNGGVLPGAVSTAVVHHGGTHALWFLVVDGGLDPVGDVNGE